MPESTDHPAASASPAPGSSSPAVAMLVTAVAAAIAMAILEYPHYAAALGLDTLDASFAVRLLVAWAILAAALVLATPALAIGVLIARRRPRIGWGVLVLGGTLTSAFMMLDRIAYTGYGKHLLGLLEFADTPEAASMAGGVGRWLGVVLGVIAAWAVGWVVLAVASNALVRRRHLRSAAPPHNPRKVALYSAAALALLIAGPWALRNYLGAGMLFERILGLYPIDWRSRYTRLDPQPIADPVLAAIDRRGRAVAADAFTRLTRPIPIDRDTRIDPLRKPDIVLLVCESLNHRLDHHGLLPKVRAWGESGLQLRRHYSGSHHSETSLFSILYGREPIRYHATLDAKQPPQMNVTLAAAGYESAYFSGHPAVWWRREEYINDRMWDRFVHDDAGEWPDWDRRALDSAAAMLNAPHDRPLLVTCLLITAHYPYRYPATYTDGPDDLTPSARRHYDSIPAGSAESRDYIEYQRAVRYLDDLAAEFIAKLDPANTLIVFTGDHGESLMDDGGWGHHGPLSDARTQTPIFIVGPGVPRRTIDTATLHADVLPTLLHALTGRTVELSGVTGRDLLADDPPRDQVLLAYPDRDGYTEMVAIRGPRRLAFVTHLRMAGFRVLGFEDADGRLIADHGLTPADADDWVAYLHQQLGGL